MPKSTSVSDTVRDLWDARRVTLRTWIETNCTQDQLAEWVGVKQNRISNLLAEGAKFSEDVAARIEDAIRAHGLSAPPLCSPDPGATAKTELESDLLWHFRRLEPGEQAKVIIETERKTRGKDSARPPSPVQQTKNRSRQSAG